MMKLDNDLWHSRGFRFGWWILFIISLLVTLSHFLLIFSEEDKVLYVGWTALGLFSTIVLLIPFRRGERWAWLTSWILAITLVVPILFGIALGPYYLGGAALLLVGMLLTSPAFAGR